MLKGTGDLQQLAAKIVANSELKQDYVADTSRLWMRIDEDKKPLVAIADKGEFPVLPLAHDQIGSKLGIPAKYYDRCLLQDPDLLAHNVNTWFHKDHDKRMLRTLGGDLRAFLSNRYQRTDYEDVAKVALPVLLDLPQVQIPSCEVTEKRMYIHFVVPTVQGEVKKGDIVQAGGILRTSEVGCGATAVEGLVWRLVCLNGMKTAEAFRRNHVGRNIEDEGEIDWSDDTRRADDTAVLLKVRDMVKAVVDETRFKATLDKMRGLTQGRITGDPSKAVEVLAKKIGATEGEQGGILRALIEGGDLSAWGVTNAVTAQAHTAQNYDRAYEFESAGGRLLELAKNEWKEILEAA